MGIISPLSDLSLEEEDALAAAAHQDRPGVGPSALEQFPAEYWAECDRLHHVAIDAWKAVYANVCVKADGYAFAVVALVPGHHTFFEGPARSDRLDAWKAFIDLRKDAA
jgi:hypothetical protein